MHEELSWTMVVYVPTTAGGPTLDQVLAWATDIETAREDAFRTS
jgi:hypothetical protein